MPLTTGGDYEISVSATAPVGMCSFQLWRSTQYYCVSYSYSSYFIRSTWDNPFYVTGGSGGTVYSSKYYGGSALETFSGRNTSVAWNTNNDYNLGVVIGTGPNGGTGTVFTLVPSWRLTRGLIAASLCTSMLAQKTSISPAR